MILKRANKKIVLWTVEHSAMILQWFYFVCSLCEECGVSLNVDCDTDLLTENSAKLLVQHIAK